MDFCFFVKIPVTRRNIFVHPEVFQPMVTIRVLLYWEGYFCIGRIQKVWGVNTKVYVSSSLKTSNYSLFLYWISLTSYFWSKTALEIQELIMSYQKYLFFVFIFSKIFSARWKNFVSANIFKTHYIVSIDGRKHSWNTPGCTNMFRRVTGILTKNQKSIKILIKSSVLIWSKKDLLI